MISDMELATVTTRGQITLPAPIRKKLGIRQGGKVAFLEENGRVFVENVNMLQLKDRSMDFTTDELVDFSNRQILNRQTDDLW
jgi:AbrB family looped-hinge helix DNA binding protein